MDPVEISAGRLHLRPWRLEDADDVLAACLDPEVVRWTSVPSPYSLEQALEWLSGPAPSGWETGAAAHWAVCDSTTGRVLGNLGVRRMPEDGEWDVGYWTAPWARGQGVMTEALGAAARWAFSELGAQRLEWRAGVGNWGSRRVAEKAGFRVEGVRRAGLETKEGRVDAWVGSLLPSDPQADTASFPAYGERSDGVVTLRRWREDDLDVVRRACDDPLTARWLPVPSPYDAAAARHWLLGTVPTEWMDGTVASVAVCDASTGEVLGDVGLSRSAGRRNVGEVGYWTAPWARGRGVAGRATRLHAQWGVEALGLTRVEVLVDVENLPSQRAAERAGLPREGVARGRLPGSGDGPRDVVVYAWTATDLA